ncbi:uncharacterized protein LOC142633560 isoform X2 [Castanea sativa]|uniref:uncharacterized protein LOC142633560 isoform X2 n=1 Tax=Castanea sativa TaxID=21020 RepID=UPI003F6528CB
MGCRVGNGVGDVEEVTFLYRLTPGACPKCYGVNVALLAEYQLLPRRYHAWFSRSGAHSGDGDDDGISFLLSYHTLVERW